MKRRFGQRIIKRNSSKSPGKDYFTNARDINKFVKNKRIVTNTNYGIGNPDTDPNRNACPPSMCGPGQCCIPAHYTYGEIVDGRAYGTGMIYHPVSCGSCGGGGRNRDR